MDQDHRVEAYLNLKSFEEYMDKFALFQKLPRDSRIFAKTLSLMASDGKHTQREKEQLIRLRRKNALKACKEELDGIRDQILSEGVWAEDEKDTPASVLVKYKYPNGKNGDIDHFLITNLTIPEPLTDGWMKGEVPTEFCDEIAMVVLPHHNLLKAGSLFDLGRDPAMQFLMRTNRIVQAQMKMNEINLYEETYRNLRTIPDLTLKNAITLYYEELRQARHEIYESLLANHEAEGKWISEQTAFRIVRSRYKDARYQAHFSWLGGMHLDIYIPSRMAAIEYQGKQHFEPVEFFGGKEGLEDNRQRDTRKRVLCRLHGIKVLDWDFDQPLTEEYFLEQIVPILEGWNVSDLE